MGRGMDGRDAGKGRSHFRIKVRRALAEQVGRPLQAFAAGRNLRGCRGQAVIILAGEERLLEPAKAQTRRLRYAHHVPQPRNRVAEGVQPALGVLGWGCRGGKNHSRSTDRG